MTKIKDTMKIVEFETAKLAKEVGFDWPCDQVYYLKDKKKIRLHTLSYYDELHRNNEEELIVSLSRGNQEVICSAPYQSYLQKWLREKYDIHVEVKAHGPHSDYTGPVRYSCNITYKNKLKAIVSYSSIPNELFALKT